MRDSLSESVQNLKYFPYCRKLKRFDIITRNCFDFILKQKACYKNILLNLSFIIYNFIKFITFITLLNL